MCQADRSGLAHLFGNTAHLVTGSGQKSGLNAFDRRNYSSAGTSLACSTCLMNRVNVLVGVPVACKLIWSGKPYDRPSDSLKYWMLVQRAKGMKTGRWLKREESKPKAVALFPSSFGSVQK